MAIFTIDIGGSAIKYGVWDDGELKDKDQFPTPLTRKPFLEKLAEIKASFDKKYELTGLAVSTTGDVDTETDTLNGTSTVPFLHTSPPIKEALMDTLDLKLAMENDANCAGLAEMTYGIGKGAKNPIFMIIGTGVGLAIVEDGKLTHNQGFKLDEMDKTIAEAVARFRSIGASAVFMGRRVSLKKLKMPSEIEGKDVFEMAKNGDEVAQKEVDLLYENIAQIALHLQSAFHPEFIGVGGGASNNPDYIQGINDGIKRVLEKDNQIMAWLQELFSPDETDKNELPVIKGCRFKNDANLIGAVIHYQKKYGE